MSRVRTTRLRRALSPICMTRAFHTGVVAGLTWRRRRTGYATTTPTKEERMTRPQQPELARSGRTDVDPDSAAAKATDHGDVDPPRGAVPPENQPGHHPE